MKKISFEDLKNLLPLGYSTKGSLNIIFDNAKPILEANECSIVFIDKNKKNKSEYLQKTKACVIICDSETSNGEYNYNQLLIIVDEPKKIYAQIVTKLFKERIKYGIDSSAKIHPDAIIGTNVFIGPFTFIGKCAIGDNTIIFGNCYLYDNVKIGNNVVINAGSIIGAEGFGYYENDGELLNFPHIGGVIIEDKVEIGSNTCIDRGALGNTVIKSGAKIDNLVHIAHNVVIGNNSLVIANSMIGGSTIIGNNTWIAPSSTIRDGLSIGNNSLVGMGTVVTKNIPNNETWTGNPAKELKDFFKIQKILKKLIEE